MYQLHTIICIAIGSDQADHDDETTSPASTGYDFMIGSMHTMMPDDTEVSMRTTFEMDNKWQKAKFLLKNMLLLIMVSITFVTQCNGW